MRITNISVRALKPPEKGAKIHTDDSLPGFGVRVSQGGKKVFVLTHGPNRQRIKLGDVGIIKLSEAREKAKNLLAEKQLGRHNPIRVPTFKTAREAFLEAAEAKNKPRTIRDYTRLLTRYGFGEEKLDDILPNDIQRKLQAIKAPSERRHAYVALKIFFRFAYRRHFLDRNPMDRMDPPPPSKDRERVLTKEELKAVWQACTGMFGDIVMLCILLGARRSEVAQIQWDWIEADRITFPETVTKNKQAYTIPLGPMALEILHRQVRRNDTPYLFPARKTWRGKSLFYNAWGKDKAKLDTKLSLKPWVLHDLRRTLITMWAAPPLSVPVEVRERYVNHISGSFAGVQGIYNRHQFFEEMKAAVAHWEQFLTVLFSPPPG